ncbi:MAG: spheroidene monooxygenase [Pseudomonadota bacterium]
MWRAAIQTVSLSLFRFPTLAGRLWVLGQMGLSRLSFARMPEARFWKLCGSGIGEGFTPVPNTAVWAILAVWDDRATAEARVAEAPVYRRWRGRAAEDWTVFLTPTSARGEWSGKTPFAAEAPGTRDGPLAALTRATIRARHLPKFWGREPAISTSIGADPNVMFKIGIGEVPWLHQVTFSIWPDTTTMAAFARGPDGPHSEAIRAVRAGGWFKEELYARFAVTGSTGTWEGGDPLRPTERSAA